MKNKTASPPRCTMSAGMSRVDVAVTCYNYGRFLRQSVESILSQSHKDCRVIILDDASTDDTQAICRELSAEDGRVSVLRHPVNIGHVATYNEAVRLAEGDYFLLLSADDYLLPGAIERAVAALGRYPEAGLAIGAWSRHEPAEAGGASLLSGQASVLEPVAFIWDLVIKNRVSTATAFVRTDVQKRLGSYLPSLPHSGDMEMWLRFALCSSIVYLNAIQAVYREHADSMSRGYSGLDDFEQRKAAIAMHLREIGGLPGRGKALARRIRLRLFCSSLFWAALAAKKGQFGRAASLLAGAFPLTDKGYRHADRSEC